MQAQAPVNDECDAAIMLDVNADDQCTLFSSGTIENATESPDANGCGGTADDDVWYQFVATASNHVISLNNVAGSTTDLYHAVFEGDDCATLTELYCSDPNQSVASGLTIGNTYTVRVYSWTGTAGQDSTFDICVTTVIAPTQCLEADPFCSQDGLIFENDSSGTPSPAGIDYECLATQPNPSWFFLKIDEPGNLDFEIIQNTSFDTDGNPTGTELDVDFIAWGPFDSVADGCGNLNPTTSVDCSYSTASVENFSITNALNGEIYILLITNFSQDPGFISLQQTNFGDSGAGSTDCTILDECAIEINGGDQEICGVDSLTLSTTPTGPLETYQWFQNDVILTGETAEFLIVTESGDYRVEVDGTECDTPGEDEVTITFTGDCTPVCSIIDFEENFGTGTGLECGLGDATTTYLCWDGVGQLDDGEYVLSNTATGLNDGWHPDMEDHTEGDVDGRALFVNADVTVGEFYRRTITLNTNTDYQFSSWITTVYDTDTGICGGTGIPSNVIFRIEDPSGVLIQETNTGDIDNGPEANWQEFFIDFNTGVNTDIQLVLINNSIGGCGNDLAIDDITLTLENTQPQIVAPEDLSLCDETGSGNATFDLTTVIDEVLDGQDASDFVVSFHTSEEDANNDVNEIDPADTYINVSNPETIFVRVESAGEPTCYSYVDFDLIVDEIIVLDVNVQAQFDLCSNDNLPTLDATPQNPVVDLAQVTYEWRLGATVVSTEAIYTPTIGGIYTVVVTSLPCSQEIHTTQIDVTTLPELDLGADEILCDGGSFEIIPVITDGTDDIQYLWSTGETTPTITVDATGTYDLEITVGPCTVTDSIDIFISDPITVAVTDDFRTCPDELQILSATASDSNATYQWYLNNDIISGATNSTLEITIAPGTFGTQMYSVVASVGECSGENVVGVTLYDVDNCVITQGISPNGSIGMNDSLDLEFLADRTGGIPKIQIFNRLGTLVFEKSNYIKEWVGQDNDGNELPTGTYYYVIDFLEPDSVYGPQATGWIYINRESN